MSEGSNLEAGHSEQINRSIANEICGSSEPLTAHQLVFLCQITATKSAEVAVHLGVNRSNVSVWANDKRTIPKREGTALKKWFWRKIFGPGLGECLMSVPAEIIFDDEELLKMLRLRALEMGAAFAVSEEKTRVRDGSSKPGRSESRSSDLH